VDPRLGSLASEQDGLLALGQLRDAGLSAWAIRRLVGDGSLRRTAPGVYAIVGAPVTHRRRLRQGLLSLGPDAFVSFEAAAALHGLDRSDPGAVELTVPRARRGRHRSLDTVVHTTRFVGPLDVVVVDGLRTSSATRTVIDLALARRSPMRIEAAIDSAVRLGSSSPAVIARRLESLRGSGRWGCRLIDRLLADSGGHSPLERRFLGIVRELGLPRPLTQVIHRRNGRHVARVDFLFADHGVVVEVTGRRGHSTPADRARDAQRRNELQDLGRKVYEFTFEQVTRRPGGVGERLRQYLDHATASAPDTA
jgi:hypothetical protein